MLKDAQQQHTTDKKTPAVAPSSQGEISKGLAGEQVKSSSSLYASQRPELIPHSIETDPKIKERATGIIGIVSIDDIVNTTFKPYNKQNI